MRTIKVPKDVRVIVCGDIHEHEEQFNELWKSIKPSETTWLVVVGDIYSKGFGIKAAERITKKIKKAKKKGFAYAIQGNHELKHIRRARKSKNGLSSALKWWDKQPLGLSFEFHNRLRVTVVHGGVLPRHSWADLAEDVETCYVRKIDEHGNLIPLVKKIVDGKLIIEPKYPGGKVWHELYDGRFGYIASGHDSQKDGVPKFYNYSCNLDTAVYNTGKLTALEFINGNKGETITISGDAKYPDVDKMFALMKEGTI